MEIGHAWVSMYQSKGTEYSMMEVILKIQNTWLSRSTCVRNNKEFHSGMSCPAWRSCWTGFFCNNNSFFSAPTIKKLIVNLLFNHSNWIHSFTSLASIVRVFPCNYTPCWALLESCCLHITGIGWFHLLWSLLSPNWQKLPWGTMWLCEFGPRTCRFLSGISKSCSSVLAHALGEDAGPPSFPYLLAGAWHGVPF